VLDSRYPTERARKISASAERSYNVRLLAPKASLASVLKELVRSDERILVVTTPSVHKYYGPLFRELNDRGNASVHMLHVSERRKSMDAVLEVCEKAAADRLDRKAIFLSVGGGICSDITAMAASLYRRGVSQVRVPTTLLAQVDAAVGIKCAVNTEGKKSGLGLFSPPKEVIVDLSFLRTLDAGQLSAGFAEVLKIAIVCDKRLFETLEANPSLMLHDSVAAAPESLGNVVWLSIGAMLEQLEPNLYEDKSLARFVDFGHTFSPAFETLSAYSVSHGQAVALDISLCAVMSWLAGILSAADRDRILTLLGRAGLATFSPLVSPDVCLRGIEEAMRHRGGSVNLVVPTGVGNAIFVSDVPFIEAMVRDSVRWLARNADVEARFAPRNCLRAEGNGKIPCNESDEVNLFHRQLRTTLGGA